MTKSKTARTMLEKVCLSVIYELAAKNSKKIKLRTRNLPNDYNYFSRSPKSITFMFGFLPTRRMATKKVLFT
jgi:hypothetical protein